MDEEIKMNKGEENKTTIQARLKILNKSLVSEENSVQYYQTLLENTAPDSDEKIGERRMYEDLQAEERKHVQALQTMIHHWENELNNL
jgi:rubrerythrin